MKQLKHLKHVDEAAEAIEAAVKHGNEIVEAGEAIIKNSDEFAEVVEGTGDLFKGVNRSNPDTYYSYDELKKLIKEAGLSGNAEGLEAHHLLEKQYADIFGVSQGDIISAPLTPQWHRSVSSPTGNNIDNLIQKELDRILTAAGKTSEDTEDIWKAHRNIYQSIGYPEWADAIYEAYVKGQGIPYN